MVQDPGCGVWGSGFRDSRVQSAWCRVWASRFTLHTSGFTVEVSGFLISGRSDGGGTYTPIRCSMHTYMLLTAMLFPVVPSFRASLDASSVRSAVISSTKILSLSQVRNNQGLLPCTRPVPRALQWSQGGGCFL
jgi:hypothetical protein